MKDWSIRRRILVSFGFILVLVVGMGAIAYTRLARIDREATAVAADSIEGLADGLGIQDAWSNDFLLTEEHALQAVVRLTRSGAEGSDRQIVTDVTASQASVIAGVVASLVLVLICGVSLLRVTSRLSTLVGQVQQSGIQVNTSVTEIAATAKEQ